MRLVLLGPQGAGKGTQAERLARITGVPYIATGDMVRAEIQAGTSLGRAIKEYNSRGELVPDEIIMALVKARLLACDSWILDGFPRTEAQAVGLDAILASAGAALDRVAALEAPDAVLIERLSSRWQSASTGRIYNLPNNPPGADDPGPFTQREDDKPAAIRRRLEIYHSETAPLKSYYAARGLLTEIDARLPIETVSTAILQSLGLRSMGVLPPPPARKHESPMHGSRAVKSTRKGIAAR